MTDAVLIVQEYGFFIIVLLCTGAITGFLAGLFGVGGGAISVPVLYEVFSRLGYSPDLAMPIAVGTSLALIIPISISSALGHKKRGTLDPKILRIWTIPIFLGVIIGATIAGFAEAEFFQIVFVIVASLISLRLLTGVGKSIIRETLPGHAIMSVAGLIIGLVSAIMGIGGGALSTIFLSFFNVSIHRAISISAAVGAIISIPGAFGYVLAGMSASGLPPGNLGFVSLIACVVFLPSSLTTTKFGVVIAHKLPKRKLEILFGTFLLLVSLRFIISFLG